MTTYNVNTSTFSSTLAAAQPGDILILADGNYSSASYSKTSSGAGVTIQAENKWGAVFSASQTKFTGNYLHYVDIRCTNTTRCEYLYNSTFTGCKIHYSVSYGCNNIDYQYCWFTYGQNLGEGTSASECHDISWDTCLFKYDPIGSSGNDFLKCADGWNYTIERCTFYDQMVYWDGVTASLTPHLDFIQMYANGVRYPYGVVIRDNWFWDTTSTHAASNAGSAGINVTMVTGCIIEGNIVAATQPNTIQFLHAATDNTCYVRENLATSGHVVAPYNDWRFVGGGVLAYPASSSGTLNILNNVSGWNGDGNSGVGSVNRSGNITGLSNSAHLDWSNNGANIEDYVPVPGSIADVSGRWRDRLNAIINNTEDFYHPTSGLILAGGGSPSAPVITGTLTINGTEAVNQILTASGVSVSGYPTPTLYWQWYNSASGAISGATSSTYQLQSSDEGDTVQVGLRAVNTEDSDSVLSASTGVISAAPSAPTITNFSPADNATNVSPTSLLTLTFDKPMKLGSSGNVNLWRPDGGVVDTWNVITNAGQNADNTIHADGNTVIIQGWAAWPMHVGVTYSILIDDGALEDSDGIAFPGISDTTVWNFTVGVGALPSKSIKIGTGPLTVNGKIILVE